jgi:hypothetical protein
VTSDRLWRAFALSVLIATAAFVIGYSVGHADAASGSAAPVIPTAALPAPSESDPGRQSQAPSPAGTTSEPIELVTRSGIIAYADESFGPGYLAIPIGPGYLVQICGPASCIELVSTDAGPNREMLRAGRIADLAVGLWEQIAGVNRSYGLTVGTWTVVGRG